ncbi:MAG: type I DNA topoisomerase [Vicinamibacteraceae bacterium]
MAKPLVIVESPAKAKTLSRFLGGKFRVEASVGHIRDLPERASEVPKEIKDKPWGRMAVDVDGDFTPYYVIPLAKRKRIAELRAALKDASEVLLATDPDREGESISAHLQEVLQPKVPTRRIVFHEITEEAVREVIEHARDIDANLVKAQEGRRILDRLFGYTLSPVLWKKVGTGLSAGRVQSVAVRLIVEREEERRAFHKASFWDLEARIGAEGREFTATMVRLADRRIASGKDFDAATGKLKESAARLLTEADAGALATDLRGRLPWAVTAVEERPQTQRPSPPFTTSTLQQEANRKLGFSADRTMKAAQGLHDEGLISYHRTDSTTLSQKALGEAAKAVTDIYGAEFHTGPRQYQTKVRNAQEAHEAIRPTDFDRRPQQMSGLDVDEARIYELIWKRAIASQMADARLLRTSIEITAPSGQGDAVFTASGKAIQFAGFLRAYVEGSDDPAAALDDQETILPKLTRGQPISAEGTAGATLARLESKGHETTPPARYTDASLVKRLEDEGIGRPSTYASIIKTILGRGYVFRQGKALIPSFTAFAVTSLLRSHFGDYVDLGFTAEMEEDLDQIASGERTSFDFVRDFYRGTDGRPGLEQRAQLDDQIPYPAIDVGIDPELNLPIRVRIGRFGPFLARGEGGEGHTASLPDEVAPADFTVEEAVDLLNAKAEGPRALGVHPTTAEKVYLLTGRYGPYVQLGEMPEKAAKGAKAKAAPKPKRASLPKSLFSESTLTLDQALQLLTLPREVGTHPDDGKPIVANFGPYSPYVKHNTDFRSLDSEAAVFEVTLDQAVELFRQPKQSRRQSVSRTVLNALGARPGTEKAMQVLSGRYGPYVTDGTTHASLPKGADPATITIAEAEELLKAREALGPPQKKGARKSGGARRPPARKAAPRKGA